MIDATGESVPCGTADSFSKTSADTVAANSEYTASVAAPRPKRVDSMITAVNNGSEQ